MQDPLSATEPKAASEPTVAGVRLSRGRLLWMAALAVATLAALLALGDMPTTLNAIQQANWSLVGLAVLIHYSGFAVRGHRWQLLLRAAGHRLGYLRVTSVLLGGWFVSAILPARLGEVFRIAALRVPPRPAQPPVPIADSLSSIILERALDITALLALSAAFGYLALGKTLPAWVTAVYAAALSILLLLTLLLLVAPGILDWLNGLSANRWWTAVLGFAQQTVASLRTLPSHPRIAVTAVAESLYIWLCDALLLWLVLAAVGAPLTFANAGFTALTVDISAAVPLTPGGMGQIEAAYAALLALLNVPPAGISAAVLLARIITYWSFLLFTGGVLFVSGLGGVFVRQTVSASTAEPVTAAVAETKSDGESS